MKKILFILIVSMASIPAFSQVELVSSNVVNDYSLLFPGELGTSYTNGFTVTFKSNFTNTAAPTMNINGIGPKPIMKRTSTPLAANDILAGMVVILTFDGNNFQMTNATANAVSVTGITGTGTQNFLPKFNNTGGTTIGNSQLFDNGTNFGLGITTPASFMEMSKANTNATGTDGTLLSITNSNGNTGTMSGIRFKVSNDNTTNTFKSGIFFQNNQSNGRGDLIFAVTGSGGNSNVTLSDEVMRVTNGGFVGIGTTTPKTSLEVKGAISLTPVAASITLLSTSLIIGDNGYIQVTATVPITMPRLSDGLQIGQKVIIENASSVILALTFQNGTASNLRLAGGNNCALNQNGTLSLIWNGTIWIETSRSQ